MKVVQINGASINGSTGKIVSQLSEVMTDQGMENYIISSGYKEKDTRNNVFSVSNNGEVKKHQILSYLFGDAGFHSSNTTRQIIRIIDNIQPDIVHLHHIYGYWLNVEMLLNYLKEKHVRVVWTLHDFWAITGHCTHFEAVKCDKWKTGCYRCVQSRSYPYSLVLDRSSELYKRKKAIISTWNELEIICVSEWVARYVSQSYMKNKIITVIPNGIDLSVFHPADEERDIDYKDKYIILGVAMSWGERKGLDDFIRMSMMLKEDERIVLIGLSEQQRKNMPANIIGLPRTSSAEELCRYYNIADVYVSASVEETMGLTAVEAMACGTPAVVYEDTALADLITEKTGRSVPQDPASLYSAVSEIRKKGKMHYHDACAALAEKNYDKWKQYNKYCEYYRNMSGEVK